MGASLGCRPRPSWSGSSFSMTVICGLLDVVVAITTGWVSACSWRRSGYLGAFLGDPVDVPGEVGDCIAAQLDVAASCLAVYAQREKTRLEHQWEIAREFGYREFGEVERELAGWG
jgi:hypothetical protein